MAYKKVCVLAKMLQNRALTMEDKGLVIVSEETTMASKIEIIVKDELMQNWIRDFLSENT